MMGDWGIANLHRLCGWLAAEMGTRTAPGSRFATWNGRGGADAVEAVLSGCVDTGFLVPAAFGRNVVEGKGIAPGCAAERLRAIATLPQDDRLVVLVDGGLGVRSFEDLRSAKLALRIAAGVNDGVNMVGYATHRLLEAVGLPRATIESWGGAFLEGETPWDVLGLGLDGSANVVIFEAIMLPLWADLLRKRDMIFFPVEDEVLTRLEADFAMPRGTVPARRFPGLDASFETVDFSDFLLLCRDDLADDVAYLMAWCACETTATIEAQYRHLAAEDSPLTYPLEPRKISQTSVQLHDGAARYYRDAGLL
jgi:TRAP-type uncharacterized transport system substrate-binding protein